MSVVKFLLFFSDLLQYTENKEIHHDPFYTQAILAIITGPGQSINNRVEPPCIVCITLVLEIHIQKSQMIMNERPITMEISAQEALLRLFSCKKDE